MDPADFEKHISLSSAKYGRMVRYTIKQEHCIAYRKGLENHHRKTVKSWLKYCHIYHRSVGGWGVCPCCKKDKQLTEHHAKEINKKIMVCRECHNVIEEYIKLLAKYGKADS